MFFVTRFSYFNRYLLTYCLNLNKVKIKLTSTCRKSVGQNGHSIFVLKWNRILNFFVFRFHYQIKKRISNTNFNEFCSLFLRNFFWAQALLWSVTSPKLPLKNESFHLYLIFQKIENKALILIFV